MVKNTETDDIKHEVEGYTKIITVEAGCKYLWKPADISTAAKFVYNLNAFHIFDNLAQFEKEYEEVIRNLNEYSEQSYVLFLCLGSNDWLAMIYPDEKSIVYIKPSDVEVPSEIVASIQKTESRTSNSIDYNNKTVEDMLHFLESVSQVLGSSHLKPIYGMASDEKIKYLGEMLYMNHVTRKKLKFLESNLIKYTEFPDIGKVSITDLNIIVIFFCETCALQDVFIKNYPTLNNNMIKISDQTFTDYKNTFFNEMETNPETINEIKEIRQKLLHRNDQTMISSKNIEEIIGDNFFEDLRSFLKDFNMRVKGKFVARCSTFPKLNSIALNIDCKTKQNYVEVWIKAISENQQVNEDILLYSTLEFLLNLIINANVFHINTSKLLKKLRNLVHEFWMYGTFEDIGKHIQSTISENKLDMVLHVQCLNVHNILIYNNNNLNILGANYKEIQTQLCKSSAYLNFDSLWKNELFLKYMTDMITNEELPIVLEILSSLQGVEYIAPFFAMLLHNIFTIVKNIKSMKSDGCKLTLEIGKVTIELTNTQVINVIDACLKTKNYFSINLLMNINNKIFNGLFKTENKINASQINIKRELYSIISNLQEHNFEKLLLTCIEFVKEVKNTINVREFLYDFLDEFSENDLYKEKASLLYAAAETVQTYSGNEMLHKIMKNKRTKDLLLKENEIRSELLDKIKKLGQ